MYLGHLAAGLVLKARVREAPLAWLLLATVLSDLFCGLLLVLGLETIVVRGSMVFSHARAVMPYSHSLLGTLALALPLAAIAARVFHSRRVGIAVGLAVISHYVLDALSHLPDMPLIGFGVQHDLILGTHLAAYPLASYLVELAWCMLAWAIFDRTDRRLLWTMLILMASYSNTLFGYIAVPQKSGVVIGASMLVLFAITPALLLWAASPRTRAVAAAAPGTPLNAKSSA
jgi:hypothetical protein